MQIRKTMQNETTHKYDFSLTAASLRVPLMVKVAKEMRGEIELNITEDIGGGNEGTGKRMYYEAKKRMASLTNQQLQLLITGNATTQKQLAFLSVCKCFSFIREFVIEVLRENFLLFNYQVSESEYRSFFRRKNELHPEMDDLTDLSKSKIKQVTFKILEQAGIIDNIKSKNLQSQLLEEQLVQTIVEDHPNWLAIFFYSDLDIIANKNHINTTHE